MNHQQITPGLVTVIIATYKRPIWLREAMASVIAQTYRPIELIVVDDDGAQSESRAVVEELKQAQFGDTGLAIQYRPQEHMGHIVAKNRALAAAAGEFIQFLDDDDSLHSGKLQRQMEEFQRRPVLDVVVCEVHHCDAGLRPVAHSARVVPFEGQCMVEYLVDPRHDIVVHAPLYRHSALREIGGLDERITHGGEVDWHLRLAIAGARFAFLPDALASVRYHTEGGRMTLGERTIAAGAELEFYQRIVNFAEALKNSRDERLRFLLAGRIIAVARQHYATGRAKLGEDCLEAALALSPNCRRLCHVLYHGLVGRGVGAGIESARRLITRGVSYIGRKVTRR